MPSVMELAASAIRGCIVAPPGKKLVVADLSNIEGRVLAWLAGEEWKLQAFRDYDTIIGADVKGKPIRKGHDIYNLAYARTFRIPVEEVTKDQRQVGKVLELAMGFQGGIGAFITFARAYRVDLDEMAGQAKANLPADALEKATAAWDWMVKAERPTFDLSKETWVACEAIKRSWRDAHSNVADFWSSLQDAVIGAVENPGEIYDAGQHISVDKKGPWLRITLPSGRSLSYPSVKVEDGKITYTGVNQYTRQWGRIHTYGGKLAENVTQAVARDVLAAGMLAAEKAGYEIVLSVHDELICETLDEPDFTAAGLSKLMSTNPWWAEGLPLSAAGFETRRYKKED